MNGSIWKFVCDSIGLKGRGGGRREGDKYIYKYVHCRYIIECIDDLLYDTVECIKINKR